MSKDRKKELIYVKGHICQPHGFWLNMMLVEVSSVMPVAKDRYN